MNQPKLRLGVLVTANGIHNGAWRLPSSRPSDSYTLKHYVDIAQTAERGLFDMFFLADNAAILPPYNPDTYGRVPPLSHLEPFTLLSALAAVTSHIGLAGSATTTYYQPYQVARMVASLDHLSGGRAAWNVITSANPAEAWNFGYEEHPDKSVRYERAGEFVDVVMGLWDCWEEDAFVYDKERGQYFEPSKLHYLEHRGEHFPYVKGPLSSPPTPQYRPIITQAGQSDQGKDLAARTADVVFTAQQTRESALAYAQDLRSRAARVGREGQVQVLPGLVPITGRTRSEAEDRYAAMQDAYDIGVGLDLMQIEFGIDLRPYELDSPLPPDLPPSPIATSRRDLLLEQSVREGLTLRELAKQTASYGHKTVIGTPEEIADLMQDWHEAGAADGYTILPASVPEGMNDFVDLIVPELQRRGIFRTEYEANTLRGNLGVPPVARR
jgi:alkanesulfonate monooxygenase